MKTLSMPLACLLMVACSAPEKVQEKVSVSGPPTICTPSQVANSTSGKFSGAKVLASAHEIMNTFYQNPHSTKKAPFETLKHGELRGYDRARNEISKGSNSFVTDLAEARASQYYIACPNSSRDLRNCDKLCTVPPSYIWGGMGWYEPKNGRIAFNVFSNFEHTRKISKHPGLDCSGLLYSVFAHAGLRVTKDLTKTPSAETADNTPARSYLATDSPLSCFKEVTELAAMPGDIIPWKSHILMVDTLGPDPYGVNNAKTEADCSIESLDPEKATMVVYNSKGSFDFPSEGTELSYLKNGYYRRGFFQHILMHNRYVEKQKAKDPNFTGQPVDTKRFEAVKAALKPGELPKIQLLVEKADLQLTGVGVGISRMKLAEFAIGSPGVYFELMQRACLEKIGKLPTQTDAPSTKLIKVARHVATLAEAHSPCECVAPDEHGIELVKSIDPATAREYCDR